MQHQLSLPVYLTAARAPKAQAAVEWVQSEVGRLLSGRCELWELVMTGGLWRISGKEIASAAEGAPNHEIDTRVRTQTTASALAEATDPLDTGRHKV